MENLENTFEYKLAKEQTIVYIFESITKDYIYKSKEMAPFYSQVKDIVGERSDFFVNWFKGFVSIANLDLDQACTEFNNAFTTIEHGEEYTGRFINQAFTLLMYKNHKAEAVKIWEYGVSKKLFAPLDDRFFAQFNPKEQFWTQFAPNMFVDQAKSSAVAVEDYRKKTDDKILQALNGCDFKKLTTAAKDTDLNSYRINGVSPLYYAIQFKQTLKNGPDAYAEGMVEFRTQQLLSSLDLSKAPVTKQNETLFTIRSSMRQTYQTSGLGKIMFRAYYCEPEEIETKIKFLDKIIEYIADKVNVDDFKMNAGGAMANTALYLAAEINDSRTMSLLLKKGAEYDKPYGSAVFSFKTKDGTVQRTEVPNTLIYRLISFASWESLKVYLTDFSTLASPSMTAKSDKYNITPLVYLIMTMIYSAGSEKEFNENKKITDEIIPLMQKAGAVLEENTAFGTAKKLLGL